MSPRRNRPEAASSPSATRVRIGPTASRSRWRPGRARSGWSGRSAAAAAAKHYRCPGCDQEIPPGVAHVVAWPRAQGRRRPPPLAQGVLERTGPPRAPSCSGPVTRRDIDSGRLGHPAPWTSRQGYRSATHRRFSSSAYAAISAPRRDHGQGRSWRPAAVQAPSSRRKREASELGERVLEHLLCPGRAALSDIIRNAGRIGRQQHHAEHRGDRARGVPQHRADGQREQPQQRHVEARADRRAQDLRHSVGSGTTRPARASPCSP